MKSSRVFGLIVAVASLPTTAVFAQEEATWCAAGLEQTMEVVGGASGAKASTKKSKAPKRAMKARQATPYGAVVHGPATTDAQRIPVAKPNPISREKKEGVLGGTGTVPGELIDDSNVSDSAKSSHEQR
jgi:hypothetical protein